MKRWRQFGNEEIRTTLPPKSRIFSAMSGPVNPEVLKVLVVDDEKIIADTLVNILNLNGFRAAAAYSGSEAIACAKLAQFDVLLTDVVMLGLNGIETAEAICRIHPLCKVILLSGNIETGRLLQNARNYGTDFEILAKPVHPRVIIERLERLSTTKQGT